MGCASSIPKGNSASWRKKKNYKCSINEVVVFVPVLQIPMPVDFLHHLRGLLSRELIDRLSSLRNRAVLLAKESGMQLTHLNLLNLHFGTHSMFQAEGMLDLACAGDVLELQSVLEEYLPVILGLTTEEYNRESLVAFKWRMLCEDGQETCLASAWYEVLSVVHLIAMLSMSQANLMLIPKESLEDCERKVSEESKKAAFDLLLKASGCLDYCIRHIMVHLPLPIRKNLPNNLQEPMLEAISIQALAQGVEMQLGLALECEKATLSVKRRLACEAVSYFAQAHYTSTGCYTSDGCGKKLHLFIQWKYIDAKAAAYYYHGLVLDKGNAPSDHISAVSCLFAAEDLLREGKRARLSFCVAAPVTRVPPVWGGMKHLNKKIPETASKKAQMYGHFFEQDKSGHALPDLPEFQLSLKPGEYDLPDIDASWDSENFEPQIQSLNEHLKDEEDEFGSG